jgi:hypothetical protein
VTSAELQMLTEFHRRAVELASKEPGGPAYRAWCAARRIMWMVLLAAAFLFYYLLSKLHEALGLI